jgi:hypothetical protein
MSSNRSRPARATFDRRPPGVTPVSRRIVGTRAALGTLALVGVLWSPTSASATTQRLGTAAASSPSPSPSCPGLPCQALTRTTGFQAAIGGAHNAMVVGHAGRVVSWTITVSKPNADEVSFFDKLTGGPPQAALVTLRQGSNYRFRVIGVTPIVALTALFGQTKVITLATPLPVLPGEVLGLSVSTWAPVLELGQPSETAWRASRAHGNCADVTTPTYEIAPGGLGRFECVYRNGLLTYGATVTGTPTPPAPARPPAKAPREATGWTAIAGLTPPESLF